MGQLVGAIQNNGFLSRKIDKWYQDREIKIPVVFSIKLVTWLFNRGEKKFNAKSITDWHVKYEDGCED